MAAPERFAEKSDSPCNAGTVHTWPVTVAQPDGNRVRYRVNTGRAHSWLARPSLTQCKCFSMLPLGHSNCGS